jgi:2-haloacid dehalogenase
LKAAAREHGFRLERAAADWIVEGMRELPVFDDVPAGLQSLRALGIPLAVLSNGTKEGVDALVAHNGLEGTFEHVLVADSVRRFKPAREVYALATGAFGAPPGRIMLVSGHEWDVAGAARAGLMTGWLGRGERFAPTLGVDPDVEARDLPELALILAP